MCHPEPADVTLTNIVAKREALRDREELPNTNNSAFLNAITGQVHNTNISPHSAQYLTKQHLFTLPAINVCSTTNWKGTLRVVFTGRCLGWLLLDVGGVGGRTITWWDWNGDIVPPCSPWTMAMIAAMLLPCGHSITEITQSYQHNYCNYIIFWLIDIIMLWLMVSTIYVISIDIALL